MPQVVAASGVGKHVFCEKPFTLTKADAEKSARKSRPRNSTDPGSRVLPSRRTVPCMGACRWIGNAMRRFSKTWIGC
ncbi:MAG: hypothetical protein ACE5JU_21225 [Candidatus Binatia bacterium]